MASPPSICTSLYKKIDMYKENNKIQLLKFLQLIWVRSNTLKLHLTFFGDMVIYYSSIDSNLHEDRTTIITARSMIELTILYALLVRKGHNAYYKNRRPKQSICAGCTNGYHGAGWLHPS